MNHTQKEKFTNDICGVALMCIFVELAFQMVVSSYTEFNFNINNVTKWVFICGGVVLIGAIALLIYSYLKKSKDKAFYGAELLVCAIMLALYPGCYLYFSRPFNELRRVFPIAFFIYYIGKTIYIIRHRNDIVSSNGKNAKKKKG